MPSNAIPAPQNDHPSPTGKPDVQANDLSGDSASARPVDEAEGPSKHLIFDGVPIPIEELEKNAVIIQGNGEFLGGGATGLVERLRSGDVVKSAWTGRPTAPDCRREIATETRIYERLGSHPRLVQMKHWDPVDCTLTLEYMPNGNLKDYLAAHDEDVSPALRCRWAIEAAEGIELLHSYGIIQGDVGPHNFLLDDCLGLRICDFGGSSLDGSRATVIAGVRYRLPSPPGQRIQPATVTEDLFALGSTIYFIATGRDPCSDLSEEDVERLYRDRVFPELSGVPFAESISQCWKQEAESAGTILEFLRSSSSPGMMSSGVAS